MREATIVGLGLIGGSIGKALAAAGWSVSFLDPAVTADEARAARAAQEKLAAIDGLSPECVVILSMPIDVTTRMIEQIPPIPNLLTSVCSVMSPLESAARRRSLNFVAGHPLAGSHLRGLGAADAELFRGRPWFVDESAGGAIDAIIGACGATKTVVSSSVHDRAIALTSHLPQLLSTALASLVHESGVDTSLFAGSGLKTFLRLAGSDRSVWHSVFESNSENIDLALARLEEIIREIANGDDDEHFERAQRTFERLP